LLLSIAILHIYIGDIPTGTPEERGLTAWTAHLSTHASLADTSGNEERHKRDPSYDLPIGMRFIERYVQLENSSIRTKTMRCATPCVTKIVKNVIFQIQLL
jgi:hypothetical protein